MQDRLAARREGFAQTLALLDSGDEFVKVLGQLAAADQRTRTESIRLSVELGVCDADSGLLVLELLGAMDRSAERSVAAVLGGGGQVAVARSFVQTASDLSRRHSEVEVMVSELAVIAAGQASRAAAPLDRSA